MSELQLHIINAVLDQLWDDYTARVSYARKYAKMVREKGGIVQNDHIALRTLNTNTGQQPAGIAGLARIFIPLGYQQKEHYLFESKHLTAWHYEHENPANPKLFISQLEVDKLPSATARMIQDAVCNTHDPLTAENLEWLSKIGRGEQLTRAYTSQLIQDLVYVFDRPWDAPRKKTVLAANEESQYAAWVLLHGNSVNHFTASINNQNVAGWPDLEATANALKAAGIPMKKTFEGAAGSKLRQTSTEAVMEACDVEEENGTMSTLYWTYAYYELAERGMVKDAEGRETLFTAFLGEQATNLFEITKTTKII